MPGLGLGLSLQFPSFGGAVTSPPARPAFSVAPVATSDGDLANPVPGDILHSTSGTASGSPSFAYQWKYVSDDSNAVGSGTATANYTIDDLDIDAAAYCHVTATNAGGSATANSNESGTVSESPGVIYDDALTDWTNFTGGTGANTRTGTTLHCVSGGSANYAALQSHPLGFFTLDVDVTVNSQAGAIAPIWLSYPYAAVGSSLTMNIRLDHYTDSGGTVKVAKTLSFGSETYVLTVVTGATYHVKIQSRLGQLKVTITPSGGSPSHVDIDPETVYPNSSLGPQYLSLGWPQDNASAFDVSFSNYTLTRTPSDAYVDIKATETLGAPLVAIDDQRQVCLDVSLQLMRRNITAASGSMTRYWLASGASVYVEQFPQECFFASLLLSEINAITTARGFWKNFLETADSGRILYDVGPGGEVYTAPTGCEWSQHYPVQMCYLLSFDGDCTWFTYATLQAYLTWWETNRASNGVFWASSGQEGWDGNVALNPSLLGGDSQTKNTYEWIGHSAMLYREYLAMQAIATNLGHTSDATSYASKAAALKTAIQSRLWDSTNHWFFARNRSSNAFNTRYSGDAVYALFCGVADSTQAQYIRDRIMDPAHFFSDYGITSLDMTDTDYAATGADWAATNWNGPIWPEVSYFAAMGLSRYGYTTDARSIAANVAKVWEANAGAPAPNYLTIPGEWNTPATGVMDGASSAIPYTGRAGGHIMAEWHLRNNYDPTAIDPTTVVRSLLA